MLKCAVPGCERDAVYEVILYDIFYNGEVVFKTDHTCPYICKWHAAENELEAEGERRPRGDTIYPFTNLDLAQGFTIYRPLIARE